LSELTDKIRSKGYWDVAIRPLPYTEHRVDYGELDEILPGAAVRLRGWPVPYIDYRDDLLRGNHWIGQDVDAEVVSHYEAWRFFTSGQFNQLRSVSADWRTGREATPVPAGFTSVIEIWEILYYVTEVFELAARLALGPAGDEEMNVDVSLNGLNGRALVVGHPRRVPFSTPRPSTVESQQESLTLPRDQLVAEPREKALEMSREFFLRFGWKPSIEQLAEHQQELADGS
jgi:hypothetical protein